jgi:formate hydrogenlyase subunit 3/multisubunit Na+/H+ antiporter MnhD subunit
MSTWKSIIGGLLAVVAVMTVGGSTFVDSEQQPQSSDSIVFAAATFLSVLLLHWLLWRFIVPTTSALPAEITSLFRIQPRRGFFSGTIAFGYVQVSLYCAHLTGYLRDETRGHNGFLVMGLSLIALGTAARLRDVFTALNALHASPHTNA